MLLIYYSQIVFKEAIKTNMFYVLLSKAILYSAGIWNKFFQEMFLILVHHSSAMIWEEWKKRNNYYLLLLYVQRAVSAKKRKFVIQFILWLELESGKLGVTLSIIFEIAFKKFR